MPQSSSMLARKRNRRFRLLLDNAGPPLVRSYPSDNLSLQVTAGLRDSDADDTGISSFGSIQDSLPPDFDATNGATGTASSKGVKLSLSALNAALNDGGCIRFEVPLADLDTYPSADEYYVGKGGGGYLQFRNSTQGYLRSRIPDSAHPIRIYTEADVRAGVDSSSHVEIACYWDGSNAWFEVDKLPFRIDRTEIAPDSEFSTWYLTSLSTVAGTGDGLTMRDVKVFTGTPNYTANPDYGKIVFFGDSFIRQGALSSTQVAQADIPWDPGYGFDLGGGASSGGTYTSDCGLIAAFMRECYRGGLQPGESNHNDAEGGDNLADCLARAQTWFSSNTAQVAVISIGTNNVDTSEFGPTTQATHTANYKSLIDECVAGGCNRIVINTVASLRNDPTYQTSAHNANIAWWNDTLVPELQAYNNRVVVADCFTAMGGLTPDSTLFQSNNVHPNAKGQHVYGRTLGEALMASF